MKATRAIANFDSASAMLRALARFLDGRDFPHLGVRAPPRPVARLVNASPVAAREQLYIWSGAAEALPTRKLARVRAEEIARWVVGCYPQRAYPAAMIGSSNGAAVHLCAALGIPWLPQTFLVPVRHGGDVERDDARGALEWGAQHAPALLDHNPELQLHHMHDANQDRLMISRMAYFRVKRLRLGDAYEQFLRRTLSAGATLFVLDCMRTWPTTRVAARHIFQHGAVGGMDADEYRGGPARDAERPEAEWGFERALLDDVRRLAGEQGWQVQTISFGDADDLSPLVADLYRAWYRERGIAGDRLLVESFILLEPYWALRTGCVPLWTTFSVEPSAARVEAYLEAVDPYDEVHAFLFSHGVESVGIAMPDRWREVFARARRHRFAGVDIDAFPRDFAAFVRYQHALKEIPERHVLPEPMPLARLHDFVAASDARYGVTLSTDPQ